MKESIQKRQKRVVFLSAAIFFIVLTAIYFMMLNRDIKSEKERYMYIR